MDRSSTAAWVLALACATIGIGVATLVGCSSPTPSAPPESYAREPVLSAVVAPAATAALPAEGAPEVEAEVEGDPKRGKRLVGHYECARCHDGTGEPAPFFGLQCKGCHARVVAGDLPFSRARIDAWRASLHHYVTTPDLVQAGRTLRASWLASFLREPTKVRPHMEEWMPRLRISAEDAADIAAFLTAASPTVVDPPPVGSRERGQALAASSGCFACHEFTGAPRGEGTATIPPLSQDALGDAIVRAPDLRFVRDRFRRDTLVAWIQDPSGVRKGALMPALGLSEEEARDLAAYLLTAKLEPPRAAPAFEPATPPERKVTYEEVASRVFRKSCVHCHSEPDGKGGDPGPGSAGGLGFAAREVRLSSYAGLERGYVDEHGVRKSLLLSEPEPELERRGASRLVAALLARHEETSGRPIEGLRGMPLGLPGLPAEDIALIESWVAQGAPMR